MIVSGNSSEVQNSDLLNNIFKYSTDRVYVVDSNNRLLYFNPEAQKYAHLFGLQELKTGIELVPTSNAKTWKTNFQQAFEGKEINYQFSHQVKDETWADYVSIFPLKDKKENIYAVACQIKKLTAKPFEPKDILESSILLFELFQILPVGITIKILETQELITFNNKICEMFNCTSEEFRNYNRNDFVHEEDTEAIKKNTQLLINKKITSFIIDKQYKKKDGSTFWGRATRAAFRLGNQNYQIGILESTNTQKKYEQQLIRNEAKIRAIFNATDDKIFAIDKEYKLIDFNQTAADTLPHLFELDKLEIGKEMLSQTPESRKLWIGYYNDAIAGKTLRLVKNYVGKEDNKIDMVTISPIQNDKSEIIGAVVSGKEVTEKLKAEQEAREVKLKLVDAQKLGNIGTIKYELETEQLNWSDGAKLLLDFHPDEAPPTLEESIALTHPEDLPGISEAVYKSINQQKGLEYTFRLFTKKGNQIYLRAKMNPIFKDNTLKTFEVSIQDITQLKEIEENIENTRQKYRDLFDNINDAIVITNESGIMIDSNSAAQELLGYNHQELQNLFIKDIVHPDDIEKSKTYLQRLIKNGFYTNYQGRIVHKNGNVKYIQVNSNAIYDENGKMIGSQDIVRDFTELKKAEEKREHLLKELEDVNKELKDFAFIVSHDLKAPLRAINTLSHWLSEDYKEVLDEKGQQQLNLLSNRVNRMHQFIDGIFEYTKLGRINETKEIINLSELLTNITLMLNVKENVEINLPKNLPEVYGEKIKLEQVFQNLLNNAIKYNDKDICKIDITFEDIGTHLKFFIKDFGKGIEQRNFEKIFQIFQTLHPKDDFESTGIGLTIVKRIIQQHGGEIFVESELGKHTTFIFTLKK